MTVGIPEIKQAEKKRIMGKFCENSGKGELVRLESPNSVTGKTTAETVKSVMLEHGCCFSCALMITLGLRLDNELDPHAPAEARTTGWTSKPWYTESKTQLVSALTAAKAKLD
ncbi:hypothetical protein RvY_03389 [Ramazzottius varieornatus]|uniref:Uncharacterized protein n=1 Tax=Ramazzottius varieornatus TaxID=947166 RepID=A0A1D1UXA0_RAMVA|nr:hypothetical protein RvY_03389 [Ramazzottius varieornatus]